MPPRSSTEQKVAAIWRELLGVDEVGAFDDFLELGGHSLLATRLVARLQTTFGVRVSLVDFFDAPTVATLAEAIDRHGTADAASTRPPGSLQDARRRAGGGRLVALGSGDTGRPLYLVHAISGGSAVTPGWRWS